MGVNDCVARRTAAVAKQLQEDSEKLAASLSTLRAELDAREEQRVADLKKDFEVTIAAALSAEKAQAREELYVSPHSLSLIYRLLPYPLRLWVRLFAVKKQADEDIVARATALQELSAAKSAELASALAEAAGRLTSAVDAERTRGETALQQCREQLEAAIKALEAERDAVKTELARLEDA
jgi:cell division protein FtsB